jgi:hypothetical protein
VGDAHEVVELDVVDDRIFLNCEAKDLRHRGHNEHIRNLARKLLVQYR